MKKLALLLAALLLLAAVVGGCAPSPGERIAPPSFEPVDWSAFEPVQTMNLPLYFRSADGEYLMPEMRDISISGGSSLYEAVVTELLRGPQSEDLLPSMPRGMSLESVEVSNKVANVNAALSDMLFPMDLLIARAALRQTLGALSGIEYVNLYVDTREPGYYSQPLGPISESVSDLSSYVDATRRTVDSYSSGDAYSAKRMIAVYFPDAQDSVLLAEVREIDVAPDKSEDYVDGIMSVLLGGPVDTESMKNPYETVMLSDAPRRSTLPNGRSIVTISLSKAPEDAVLFFGGIVYSIMGFVPEVQYVTFQVEGVAVDHIEGVKNTTGMFVKEDFSHLIGERASIVLPAADTVAWTRRSVAMYHRYANSPRYLLEALLTLSAGSSAFPAAYEPSDINRCFISGDLAIADFSAAFAQKCSALTSDQEERLVFSIVNTLCGIKNVRHVQILVDGNSISSFAGHIRLEHPLMPKPGIA